MEKIGIIVCGGNGRMGHSIINLLSDYDELIFIGGVDPSYPDNGEITHSSLSCMNDIESNKMPSGRFLTLKDTLRLTANIKNKVIIDFTSKAASLVHVEEAMHYSIPIVIGSTGFSNADISTIKGCSQHMPVVLSGNMSLGINVLLNIVHDASKYLGEGYDCEVVEMHHRKKKDAPSGTAKMLADSVAKQRHIDLNEKAVYGRHGVIGERTKDEIGILSVRAGDIIGEHKVIFAGNEEIIEITHKAVSRDNFARGAIKAAGWLSNKKNGFFRYERCTGVK